MAAIRARAQPVIGSSQWIQDENAQVSLFCGQEAEDFVFSARNEVEWLNEHMAEIFSKDQVNVTDVFKTPGKLRGKTPRTTRKRNPLEAREPLSDIFSSNAQTKPLFAQHPSPTKAAAFTVAEDAPVRNPESKTGKTAADSGYHGLSEDEMDVDPPNMQSSTGTHDTLDDFPHSPSQPKESAETSSIGRSTTERSFHSAKEDLTKKDVTNDDAVVKAKQTIPLTAQQSVHSDGEVAKQDTMDVEVPEMGANENEILDESRTSSQTSSPEKPLVRKSSLSFAALPAREPINTKKSFGNPTSRTSHVEQNKGTNHRSTFLERLTGGKSLGGVKQTDAAELNDESSGGEAAVERPQSSREESDSDSRMAKLHNKSSTQRLHERINMLGQLQPPRPTKSIPAAVSTVQPQYPDLKKLDQQKHELHVASQFNAVRISDHEDDDWIQPPQTTHAAATRPQSTRRISMDVMENIRGKETIAHQHFNIEENERAGKLSPGQQHSSKSPSRRARSASESKSPTQTLSQAQGENQPVADPLVMSEMENALSPMSSPPVERHVDGPLSASKMKLQSIMKSARGLFSSSAGVSAQAKMETASPAIPAGGETGNDAFNPAADDAAAERRKKEEMIAQKPAPSQSNTLINEPRKTRSSTEKEARNKEKEAVARMQVQQEKERVKQQENDIKEQAKPKAELKEQSQTQSKITRQSPRKVQSEQPINETEGNPQSSDSATLSHNRMSQAQKLKDVRRPGKLTKDAAAQPKAPPVNIRIGMPSRRVPLTGAAPSTNPTDPLSSTQAQMKHPGLVKKNSNASMQSTVSHNSVKGSAPTGKPKALIAAERKKEQDLKEAQRKLDQKREIERKRAAQQEETRRQEQMQRQEAERQRERERAAAAEDPKKIAQRQAIEKRRQEMQKKDQRTVGKPINEHASATTNQGRIAPTSRPELGGGRPPSRQATTFEHPKATTTHHPINRSKAPIKRVFDPENDGAPARSAKASVGPTYQQHDNKRRKTEDDEPEEFPMRPTMQPPIRQSGIRKDAQKVSLFNHNHTNAAAPPNLHHPPANSLLKHTTSNQAYQQHMLQNQQQRQAYHPDTAKYRDGNRIPFADNPNPPHHQHVHQPQPFKTPLPHKLPQPSRQSPQFPNPENIQLADIATDSEDSESSPDTAQKRQKAASLPEWAQSPNLRQLLEDQEEMLDADAVFGPVPSPRIEEMFRERAHKFRNRTSSANWAGSDRLTEEEIRRDVEARARIRRDRGWTYGGA
ncbi:uncharacterized protein KY384_007101 [Bacidia gigantensis]|uniref:uncharacterized protein n=1 Tax=Bacidia gigantensis TaxID=2732470 RepID=UPI001D045C47|nr:uncharacterized protein KY384_007101 [Bacidia gigantensis]KAG8528184.1 hypothetical protein KY384_007101 [Bacidia gigantensis]